MFRPSRERLQELSRELIDVLSRSRSVVFLKEPEPVQQAVLQALADELRREEERQENARKRIGAMRGAPSPDSKEWQALFHRLVEEEYLRDGLEG
jgi:hypothetical protein